MRSETSYNVHRECVKLTDDDVKLSLVWLTFSRLNPDRYQANIRTVLVCVPRSSEQAEHRTSVMTLSGLFVPTRNNRGISKKDE